MRVKYVPAGEPTPKEAKFFCDTCRMWAKSTTGCMGHHRQFPTHTIRNMALGRPVQFRSKVDMRGRWPRPKQVAMAVNGNSLLNASARDLLLDYVLVKAKEELNSELDRMFRELKSQPIGSARSRTFVAR